MHREFSEIKQNFGDEVELTITLRPSKNNHDPPLKFSKDRGIVIGNKKSYEVKMQIICSNKIISTNCLDTSFLFEAEFNFQMQNWQIFQNYTSLAVREILIHRDLINLRDRDFEMFLENLLWE